MRIVAGKYRSRIINAPEGMETRPTSDKTRQAVFNILQYYINDSIVLDLFSGSGAFGIESLSRNAKYVTFVDSSVNAINTLKNNLSLLKIINDFEIINDDYHSISTLNKKYKLIFMDPPYALDCFDEILNIIESNNLLNDNGIIIYECDKRHILDINKYPNYKIKQYQYGIAHINILYKVN